MRILENISLHGGVSIDIKFDEFAGHQFEKYWM